MYNDINREDNIEMDREELERIINERNQFLLERNSLIHDIGEYRDVLKMFGKMVRYKLSINASDRYIYYRDVLKEIGIDVEKL